MIYRLRYCNKDGVEARVDIQKGLATPVIEVEGTERPFILSYNNDKGDKSGMFLSSSADIEIYETPDFNINNLKTSNETELSVTHYINNIVSWQGFIIPDFFSIEVRNNPVITMTASDRLGTLKNVTLSDLPAMISLRELAILCLNKTGLTLPLRTMADFNNGTGINDFFNSKILTQRLSDTKGRSISCYDILSSILTASNSFLVQRSGGWHIINKIQHEAGSGKLYTGATSFINWSDVIFNFSEISIGGRRTIIPVASTVGVFHEFGGGRIYPENYDFSLDLTGWISVNGFVAVIDNRKVDNFVSGTGVISQEWTTDPVFGDTTEKKYLVNDNYGINYDFANKPYLRSSNIPVTYPNISQVKVNVEVNATGPYIDSETYRGETNFAVIASNGTSTLHLTGSGTFETLSGDPFLHKVLFDGDTHLQAVTSSRSVNGVLAVQDGNLSGYNITVRLYGYTKVVAGGRFLVTTLVNSVAVTITDISDEAKGTLYKTERTDNYTKAHDIDTSLFADYLTTGLNGYFYSFPIDDTSLIYNSNNELTSKWIAYNDTEQLPLLQHITRQRSRLFSVAHDMLSAEIEVNDFDPLAIFVACEKRYTVVSAQFDFFKSNLSVELEEVAFQNANVRDFIYSYFGDGESSITSIGGIISGGTSSSAGLSPEQTTILSQVSNLAHLHENKTELDKIKEIIESTDETPLSDENILSSLRVLSEILKNNATFLEDLKEVFLSKVEPDTAQKLIKFVEGIEVGTFSSGFLGSGAALKMNSGISELEVDKLTVRMVATFFELVISRLTHIGGQVILTPARMKCTSVVDGGTYYKCYFDTGDGEVSNEFVAGDQARCQVFTGSGTKFYWRLVTSVGTDWINLSKTDAVSGSDTPEAGDDIVQLGNRTDATRQNAIILSTIGSDAPSLKQYAGINSFALDDSKARVIFSRTGNKITGSTIFTSGGSNLEDVLDGVSSDIQDTQAAVNNLQVNNRNYVRNSRLDNLTGWSTINGTRSIVNDAKFGNVVQWARTSGSPADYQKEFTIVEKSSFEGAPITLFVIAKKVSTSGLFCFGWNGATTFIDSTSSNTNQIDLGGGWFVFWRSGTGSVSLTNSTYFGINTISGTWQFYAVGFNMANKYSGWQLSNEDVQANIDAAKIAAETAAKSYADTKAEAERVLAEAYADGIVDTEEQARIDDVNDKLAAAKAYAEAQDALLKTQQEAYADGKASAAELAAIAAAEAYANLKKTEAEAYADGKVSAEEARAIADATAKFNEAKTHADTLVNNIQIGGRNLFSVNNFVADNKARGYSTIEVIQHEGNIAYRSTNIDLNHNIPRYLQGKFEANTQYYFKFNILWESYTNSGAFYTFTIRYTDGTTSSLNASTSQTYRALLTTANKTIDYITTTRQYSGDVVIYNIQIEKANKPSDWTPAIEDVQTDIDTAKLTAEQAQLAADGYMRARYVRDWLNGSSVNTANTWNEIKIVDKSGTNLALGKTATTNDDFRLPVENITDNDITTYSGTTYTSGVVTNTYIQIDLGQIYYDIDYIQIWHYYADGRTYFGTKTEISEDGVNWTTIFDSATEGTYKETSEGKIHTQRYASVMAKMNRSKAVTDKFGTTINGGLISPVTVELREADTQDVTAGHTGIQGTHKDLPAYWAGGTYAEALAGLAKIIFRHDGTGKIGVFEVDAAGSVKIFDPDIPSLLRLKFIKSKLPSIAYLLGQTGGSGSATNAATTRTTAGTTVLTNSVNVTVNGSELNFTGNLMLNVSLLSAGLTGFASVTLQLLRNDSVYATLYSIGSQTLRDGDTTFSTTDSVNETIIVPTGTYKVSISLVLNNATGTGGASGTSTLSWLLNTNINEFIFGSDGFTSWHPVNSMYHSEDEGLFVRGAQDIPGVLASGSSTSGGVQSNVWGAKSDTVGVTVISGGFRVPLKNLTHNNYVVQITPHTSSTFRVDPTKKTNTSFEIFGTGGFDYTVIGKNI